MFFSVQVISLSFISTNIFAATTKQAFYFMMHKEKQDKQSKSNRSQFLSMKEATMNSKASTRTDTVLPINNHLTLPLKLPWSKNTYCSSYCASSHKWKKKRFGEISAVRPRKAKDSKKEETDKTQYVPSQLYRAQWQLQRKPQGRIVTVADAEIKHMLRESSQYCHSAKTEICASQEH